MITFFGTLILIFSHAFRSKGIILSENALLKKENDFLLRLVAMHMHTYADDNAATEVPNLCA